MQRWTVTESNWMLSEMSTFVNKKKYSWKEKTVFLRKKSPNLRRNRRRGLFEMCQLGPVSLYCTACIIWRHRCIIHIQHKAHDRKLRKTSIKIIIKKKLFNFFLFLIKKKCNKTYKKRTAVFMAKNRNSWRLCIMYNTTGRLNMMTEHTLYT